MSDKFQNKYRIPSARATFHNYNGGAYFVTICTAGMAHFFGEISNSEINFTEIGLCAVENIENISTHYPYAEIPLYAVMPNHIHLIVFIDNTAHGCGRDVARNVSTNIHMSNISPKYGTLPTVIRGLKSAITRYANKNNISFSWQTRFHDRIIRDHHEMNRIAEYIENNVVNWEMDKYYQP